MRPSRLSCAMLTVCLLTVGAVPSAQAGFVTTEQAIALEQRAQILSALETKLKEEELRTAMLSLGVSPEQVESRLAALSDAELAQLNTRLNELPAGAGAVELIGVVFIVLLVLELVGVTDVFTAI